MHKFPARSALLGIVLLAFTGLVLASAFMPSATASTTRTLAIWNDTAHPQVPFKGFDTNPPKVFDINGDGKMEIIAQNDNQWVYVFDSRTGAILFEATTRFPAGWGARSFNGPEVAIMSEGGATRIIVANSAAVITSFRYDATAGASGRMGFVKEWDRRANDCFGDAAMDAKPLLVDLDKDGRLEIVAATEEVGVIALRSDGSLYWKHCIGGGNAEPAVADLNLDGWPDLVHVSDGGIVAALVGRTGAWMWGYDVKSTLNIDAGSIPVGAGIGQLDGLAGPDIVVAARDSHDRVNFENNHAAVVAISSTGAKLWHFQDLEQGNPLSYCHPVIVDADKDGVNEVYWGDWNTMGHKPGAWEPTGPANFYRFDNHGKVVWRQTLNTYWSNKDIVLGDVDADGVQEVLANGPGAGGDGIWYLDSRNGAKEAFVGTHPWKVARGPILADLWNTRTMQWVVTVGPADGSVHGGGILVYNTGAPYNAVYPHLPYPSVGSNTNPTTSPVPTTTTTVSPGGSFGATFTIKAPNVWWQEVYISPDTARTITGVQVRFNDGAWNTMSKSSWGAWTTSIHAPAGTKVEFLAKDSNGATSQSFPFTWMDGSLTKRSTTSTTPTTTTAAPTTSQPAGGTFAATFTIKAPNVWWQEVYVSPDTARTITGVQVRFNGAAWNTMSKSSWGAWTTSIHAPAGTKVEFLAKDSNGATSQSMPFTWMDGTLTKRSTTGTTPTTTTAAPTTTASTGTFPATFNVPSGINNWWVEVGVSSTHTVTTVSAQVNGGAWVTLSPTDWGTWAKSFRVEPGSQVVFRATNAAGATATSGAYTWP